jgi:hypothetical protein
LRRNASGALAGYSGRLPSPRQAFTEPFGRDPREVSDLPPGEPAERQEQRLALRPGHGRKAAICQRAPIVGDLIVDARERLRVTVRDPRQKAVNGRRPRLPVLIAHRRRLRARRAGTAHLPHSDGCLTSHQ